MNHPPMEKVDYEPVFLDAGVRKRDRRRKVLKHLVGLITLVFGALLLFKSDLVKVPFKLRSGATPEAYSPGVDGCPGPKRSFRRHEAFQSITGSFSLFDELDLSTTVGAISVVIYEQPGCGRPVLNIHSATGSIDVTFVRADEKEGARHGREWQAPAKPRKDRPIWADIASKAGSIRAEVFAAGGSSISMSSLAGTIDSKIFLSDTAWNGTLTRIRSWTTSGSQWVQVLLSPDCTEKSCSTVDGLDAMHTVRGSGSMKLTYPRQWRGNLHARTIGAGTVDVSGENLNFTTKSDREVVAWRGKHGDLAGTLEASSQGSGDIRIDVDG